MTRASLQGRRVLVTGAARGIGRAVVETASNEGARVVGVDLRGGELETLRSLAGVEAVIEADLANVAGHGDLVAAAEAALGGLDALIHVAGVIVRRNDIADVSEADWDLQCNVNLKATFFLNREFALHLREQGTGGAIVNFASQGWWTGGFGGSVAYSATKGGIVSLTRGLARSLAPDGIRVNVVAPGGVDTEMMRDGLDVAHREAFVAQVPLGRMATADEVAGTALFLISDQASYVTGATLNVTGGQLMY